jgi:hypothetical protein
MSRGLDARGHEFWDPAYDWIMERTTRAELI